MIKDNDSIGCDDMDILEPIGTVEEAKKRAKEIINSYSRKPASKGINTKLLNFFKRHDKDSFDSEI